jgi:hypothetical protein
MILARSPASRASKVTAELNQYLKYIYDDLQWISSSTWLCDTVTLS